MESYGRWLEIVDEVSTASESKLTSVLDSARNELKSWPPALERPARREWVDNLVRGKHEPRLSICTSIRYRSNHRFDCSSFAKNKDFLTGIRKISMRADLDNSDIHKILSSLIVEKIAEIEIYRNRVDHFFALEEVGRMRNLTALNVGYNNLRFDTVFPDSASLNELRILYMSGNDLGRPNLLRAADAGIFDNVEQLYIENCSIDSDDFGSLLSHQRCSKISILRSAYNNLGEFFAKPQVRSQAARPIGLFLAANGIGDAWVKEILSSEVFSKVEVLDLSANDLTDRGIVDLFKIDSMDNLRKVLIDENRVTVKGLVELANGRCRRHPCRLIVDEASMHNHTSRDELMIVYEKLMSVGIEWFPPPLG